MADYGGLTFSSIPDFDEFDSFADLFLDHQSIRDLQPRCLANPVVVVWAIWGSRVVAAAIAFGPRLGQMHHAISVRIFNALQTHPLLRNLYVARDPRFVLRAADPAAHRGYQTWHRMVDKGVEEWIRANQGATPAQFEAYLKGIYDLPDLAIRFPVR